MRTSSTKQPIAEEIFYKSFFSHSLNGLTMCEVIFDHQDNPVDYRHLVVNQQFEKLTGLRNVVGKRASKLVPGILISHPELFSIYTRAAMTKKPENFEIFIPQIHRWFIVNLVVPKIGFFEATIQNITQEKIDKEKIENAKIAANNVLEDLELERNRAQDLARQLEKFKWAVASTSELIIITDREGVIVFANPALETMTGYVPAEVVGKKAWPNTLWGGLMEATYYRELWTTIKTRKESYSGEAHNRRKNGEDFFAHVTISPMLDRQGEVDAFIHIERDITREKNIDIAKTEFVSLASHQLRTPLSTVNWYTEMLLSGDVGDLNVEQKKYVEAVANGSHRMVELVNALLTVSRIELGTFTVEPSPTKITELIKSILAEQLPQLQQKKLKLTTTYPSTMPMVSVDPKILRLIVQNLLSNAIKYTKNGGTIACTLAHDNKDLNYIFKVADTGYGIPKKQQNQIFTKLFRADNVREHDTEGTGLGLYFVRAVVRHSGGNVWFESTENVGSTFYVSLPLVGMKPKKGTTVLAT